MFRKTAATAALVLTIGLSLVGCVTNGSKFTMDQVAMLQPGVATKDQAIDVLGDPSGISRMADGSILVQWIYNSVNMAGRAEGGHVAILFGPDDKMVRVTHQFQSRQ